MPFPGKQRLHSRRATLTSQMRSTSHRRRFQRDCCSTSRVENVQSLMLFPRWQNNITTTHIKTYRLNVYTLAFKNRSCFIGPQPKAP